MAAQWPLIVNGLVPLLQALPGWSQVTVQQGRLTQTVATPMYCTVGFVAGDDERAGNYMQERDEDGFQYGETGSVLSQIVCSAMNTWDVAGQQNALFTLCDAFEASVRTDRTLGGILSPTSTLSLAVDVLTSVTGLGTAQSAVLSLNYYTLT